MFLAAALTFLTSMPASASCNPCVCLRPRPDECSMPMHWMVGDVKRGPGDQVLAEERAAHKAEVKCRPETAERITEWTHVTIVAQDIARAAAYFVCR
jgi:hypothetical protein